MYRLFKRISPMDLYTLVVIDDYQTFIDEIAYLIENEWEVIVNPKKPIDTWN